MSDEALQLTAEERAEVLRKRKQDVAPTADPVGVVMAEFLRQQLLAKEQQQTYCFGQECCPCIRLGWNGCAYCMMAFAAIGILAGFIILAVVFFMSLQMPGNTNHPWAFATLTIFIILLLGLLVFCGTGLCMCCFGRGGRKKHS
jgi:hypothetical protein